MLMRARTTISAAERARWLADLAVAVDDAQVALWQMGVLEGDNADAKLLYGRLESARAEIESLRGAHEIGHEALDPEWMKLLPWAPRAGSRQP